MAKKRKIRVSFQKDRQSTKREGDLTRRFRDDDDAADGAETGERVRAKGSNSRKRTIIVDGDENVPASPDTDCVRARVLSVQGLYCQSVTDDGKVFRCYVRRLLKSMESDTRAVVATGDWVWFRPAPDQEGMIVRVEERKKVLVRGYRNREHIIVANVEQALIVVSTVEPLLKPNLIDRYLAATIKGGVTPIICINKIDRLEPVHLQPIVGMYAQLGYGVVMTSAATGQGIEDLRERLAGKETVIVGQSGVGKSSLLNSLEPTFRLKVGVVSESYKKGKHTTTTAQLLRLPSGSSVIDTPGVRQFELWEIDPFELEAYFVEFHPHVPHCRFPGCSHTHEEKCAVKDAVDRGLIHMMRYESYLKLYHGEKVA